MSYQEALIYYYLISKQKFVTFCNTMRVYLLGFSNFEMISNNKKVNLTYWFLLYNFLTKMINLTDSIRNRLIVLRSKCDINADKIHITKVTFKGEKTIILDKNLIENKSEIKIGDVINKIENIEPDENMMGCIILNFELVNSEENKICLKELVIKYRDMDGIFHHTIKNILDFNTIPYLDDTKLNIKIIKNKKIVTEEKLLKEVYDTHINNFLK